MIAAFTASWEATEASRALMACIDAGRQAMGWNDQQFAAQLGVAASRIAAMRAGLDAGPGILRFASLPLGFKVGFVKAWAVSLCLRVVDDPQMDRFIAWINFWMIKTMKRDAARMYPGEVFPQFDVTQFDVPVIEDKKEIA